MTQRLYLDDAYLREWSARVVERREWDGQPAVALDRSAFYLEAGGQPGDRGTLNGVPVLDTRADGELVWHILGAPLAADVVRAELDWERRFLFMQQHHGQHLLSAALDHLWEARTLSAHLGEEVCTVDVDNPGLTPEQLSEAEELTNQVIWQNLPILARFVERAELASIPLRKVPGDYPRIRIVSAGDFDHTPCGGTHPRHTGEVGMVVLRRWERRGATLRLEYVCGVRALRDYRHKNALLTALAGELSVGIADVPAAVQRIREAEERGRRALATAEHRLLRYEAVELIAAADRFGGLAVVVHQWDGRELQTIRSLAEHIAELGGIALLGLAGTKAHLVFARAPRLAPDMGAILREAAAIVGGRGGGRPEAAQGGGPLVEQLPAALARARELVVAELG